MDWREWLYGMLKNDHGLSAMVGGRIFSTLDSTPEDKPFIVVRMGESSPEFPGVCYKDAVIWVHDSPGSFSNIDEIIQAINGVLEGQVSEDGAVAAVWQNESPDLSDDARSTVVRNTSFRLVGRR